MNIKKILLESNSLVENNHFVYKSGKHGAAYINKETFSFLGSNNLVKIIEEIGQNALDQGFALEERFDKIGVIAPAMGAISFALTLAAFLERNTSLKVFPARTELKIDEKGKKIHVIPDKLKHLYQGAAFIIFEDIVNDGTTIKEVKTLLQTELDAEVIAAMCFVDRGGQTAESLGLRNYYPLIRVDMAQSDAHECFLCKEGVPINMVLGKGDRWVKLFGQPVYPDGTDFSPFLE